MECREGDAARFSGLLQPIHLLLILGIALIVFGPGKLASIGHDLGKSIRAFKTAMEPHNGMAEAVESKPAAAPQVIQAAQAEAEPKA